MFKSLSRLARLHCELLVMNVVDLMDADDNALQLALRQAGGYSCTRDQ
jgi:hypothetical protein